MDEYMAWAEEWRTGKPIYVGPFPTWGEAYYASQALDHPVGVREWPGPSVEGMAYVMTRREALTQASVHYARLYLRGQRLLRPVV